MTVRPRREHDTPSGGLIDDRDARLHLGGALDRGSGRALGAQRSKRERAQQKNERAHAGEV
jgi:hypothetical protein